VSLPEKLRNDQYAQEAIRFRIVENCKRGTFTQKQIAEALGVTERTVNKIWSKYKKAGKKALVARKRGARKGKKLNEGMTVEIRRVIQTSLPDHGQIPSLLWTRQGIAQLIAKIYKIELSTWQVGRYLNAWGYTQQAPAAGSSGHYPAEMREWFEGQYPVIKADARRSDAIIYFAEIRAIKDGHRLVKMISGVNNRGHQQFMFTEERMDSDLFLIFLKRIVKNTGQRICLVTAFLPVLGTKKIRDWLAVNERRIAIYLRPPGN